MNCFMWPAEPQFFKSQIKRVVSLIGWKKVQTHPSASMLTCPLKKAGASIILELHHSSLVGPIRALQNIVA